MITLSRMIAYLGFRLVFVVFCLTLEGQAGTVWGQVESAYPEPEFTPPAGHPRVYFTADDIPRLLANAKKPQNALAWAVFNKNLRDGTDGLLAPPSREGAGNMDSQVLSVIASLALDCAWRGNEAHGRRAIAALHNYLRTVVYPEPDYNNTGQTVYTIGIVYDWCYPLLSDSDKGVFIDAVIETAGKMEVGWPPVKQGNVLGHGVEGQIFRDLLCASVAVYDERPDIYNLVAGRFFDRMVEPKKFMYPAHMHHQGSHYTNYRSQWELLATWIFDRMGLPEVFGPDQRYLMYWSLYARRGDGQLLRDGDTHCNNRPLGEYYAYPFRSLMLASNYFQDPYLKMEAMRQRPGFEPMRPRGNQAMDCVELLLFNDPDLKPRPLNELPLTHYFPSPKGAMIARTGWQDGLDSPAVVAEMKINEWYFANHQHLDAGAFQIYYRGMLANDSGYYQAGDKSRTGENDGGSGYGSLHDVNYNKRSVAHNVITIYHPEETFETERWAHYEMANDGGQRMPNLLREPHEHEEMLDPSNRYRIGEVLAYGFGPDPKAPDYTYLKGDLKDAYSGKARVYERSFIFLNLKQLKTPAVLVVFDRVRTYTPGHRKAWLLHGLEEPTITGNRTVFKDTRPGYTGKLTVDTLLPEPDNTTITKIGGPDREFWVDGVNYPATLREGGSNEGGGWRIEVSPKEANDIDYFLHVLQVGDHTPDTPAYAVEKLDTGLYAGARFADCVVLLCKHGSSSLSPVTFNAESGETRVFVAGLRHGAWRVERDGVEIEVVDVTAETGVAYFTVEAGAYQLKRVAD